MTTSAETTKTEEPGWLAAARQPRWTPEIAAEVVRAWQKEGGAQSAFMRKHGLPRERLRFWSRRRAEWEQKEKPAMGFVPVEVTPEAPSQRRQGVGEAVVVEVKGVRVRVEGGASQELVERVLRALQRVQGC
ncbi:IS66 family insertion sequence element accessory protein TnpA [Stigmatella aurantiaca]|uniref:Transposase, IS66 Orf1 n=1 Tax=Stigmatella aurantiaca (strain DW4/3-1) TaxID=378806 RepID=E3FEH3_STIAD|nr:hypothetical protein [Stigmatella aurantiaca]ADO73272.1 transposase, IS66 Orf1 family protein [Stigmatella aurantiaca DW4/3-1]ADO73279.1 transposase, IS66 Orf1 family protein [Stigmatella aurantiaca DW4/3-1]ADO75129.1 Transposase, IS66 Orf1 [Stigmatella aurantiaca DW4/3-1]